MYDYVPGKVDWLAHGLPIEGEQAGLPRVGMLVHDDVVTCRLDDPIQDVRDRVEASPYGFGFVTTERRVVLGRLRASTMSGAAGDAPAETVMEPGPSTVRLDTPARDLAERLAKRSLATAVVTTPEGRFVGVVRRRELESAARRHRAD